MNAVRPGAATEYSTGDGRPWRRFRRSRSPRPDAAGAADAAVNTVGRGRISPAAGGLAIPAAAILVLAEVSHLLVVRTVTAHPRTVHTEATGPHHGWALLPIAALALILAGLALSGRGERRILATGLGLLGLAALAVALGVDLPAVRRHGYVGSLQTGLIPAQAHAGAGIYLETLGAIGLLVAGAAGMLLAPRRLRQTTPAGPTMPPTSIG